jgi:5-formyltetrahydrofolate cyclo-ligase
MTILEQKQAIRQQMRALRQALNDEEHRLYAQQLLARFQDNFTDDDFPMALYLSVDGELDTHPLILDCWARQRSIFLPVVVAKDQPLTFMEYLPDTELRDNLYGIGEPINSRKLPACELSTMCLPLTAFDTTGARLGMGGGFYDRTLAICEKSPKLVGLAFDFQEVDSCPTGRHDQPLDWVLTPADLIKVSNLTT